MCCVTPSSQQRSRRRVRHLRCASTQAIISSVPVRQCVLPYRPVRSRAGFREPRRWFGICHQRRDYHSPRQGKTTEALDRLRQTPDSSFFHTRALQACYSTPARRTPKKFCSRRRRRSSLIATRNPDSARRLCSILAWGMSLPGASCDPLSQADIVPTTICNSIPRWRHSERRPIIPSYSLKPNNAATGFWLSESSTTLTTAPSSLQSASSLHILATFCPESHPRYGPNSCRRTCPQGRSQCPK